MNDGWTPRETTTHQDHVIAHVLGATVLGFFILDEALYLLLDIGFVWTIFLDGEMSLLPHPVAIGELDLDIATRNDFKADVDSLLSDAQEERELLRMQLPVKQYEISDVTFFEHENQRRLLLNCEAGILAIEMSLESAEIKVYEFQQ